MRIRHFILTSLFAFVALASCEQKENDLSVPSIKLSTSEMTFDAKGGDQTLTLTATRDWKAECGVSWLKFEPDHGSASTEPQTIVVTALENNGMDQTANVKFTIGMTSMTLTVTQKGPGGSAEDLIVYANDFDKEEATQTYGTDNKYWPYLDQFDGWMNHKGTGAKDVTYAYKGLSCRNNSNSDSQYSLYKELASGGNNLLFAQSGGFFHIKGIALGDASDYALSFGATKYAGDENHNTVIPDEFKVYISNDSEKWVELSYSYASETLPSGNWDLYTSSFTLPEGTSSVDLLIKTSPGAQRIDDVKLSVASEAGTSVDFSAGVEVDLAGGSTGGNQGGGQEPDETAIYHNNFDKEAATKTYGSGSSWPYLDQFDGWMNHAGSGSENVTYNFKGASARNNSNSDGEYSDYAGSGLNNIFFGKTPYFAVNGIALGNVTNLTLTFGTEKYSNDAKIFTNSEFHIWLSNDGGAKWVEFTDYTFAGGTTGGRWNVATADITVPSGTETLSICMQVDVESAYRIDDLKLVAADAAGTSVDFTGAVEKDFSNSGNEGGEDPVPPVGEGSLMTIAEVLASTSALPSGSYIEAVVISDRSLNNLTSKKGLYVQDETAGLQFYLAENHELNFGDKVKIDLSGVTVGEYNGAVQVSSLALSKIETISTGNPVEPKTVTVADFLANKYEGQYVALEGVQVIAADLSKTFVEGGAHTSITLETADGERFVIFSSKYASYGEETVPQGSGTIKGISSISKGAMQIIFAQASDYAGLTGERFTADSGNEGGDEGGNEGGEVTPPAGGDDEVTGTVLTISRSTINGIEWTTNGYGSQNISDLSTYLSWSINGAGFIGAKMCLPASNNAFVDIAIQCQGNTDAAKQSRFGNTTSLGKIKKITIVSHNEKYTPNFNLALGTEQVVGVSVPESMIPASDMETTKDGTTYTTVYTPAEDVGFFAVYKNTTGALYFSEVKIEYEVAE